MVTSSLPIFTEFTIDQISLGPGYGVLIECEDPDVNSLDIFDNLLEYISGSHYVAYLTKQNQKGEYVKERELPFGAVIVGKSENGSRVEFTRGQLTITLKNVA